MPKPILSFFSLKGFFPLSFYLPFFYFYFYFYFDFILIFAFIFALSGSLLPPFYIYINFYFYLYFYFTFILFVPFPFNHRNTMSCFNFNHQNSTSCSLRVQLQLPQQPFHPRTTYRIRPRPSKRKQLSRGTAREGERQRKARKMPVEAAAERVW